MVPATAPLIGFSGEIVWPIGQISLSVKIGDTKHLTSIRMNFVAVRSPSPYNEIIGRLGGIVENVLIKVKDSRISIILGRPFLATARAMINVFNKKITLKVGDDEVIFDMEQSMKKHYTEDDECYSIDDLDETINEETHVLLENEQLDSFLLNNLEKTITQMDQENYNSIVCEFIDDSKVNKSIWRIDDINTTYSVGQENKGSELGSKLTFLAGSELKTSELDTSEYRFLKIFILASYERELCKENGVNILKSIDEGPFQMGTFRETLAEGALHLGPERPRIYSDLSPEDKERYNADIRATNILLQGLSKDIYTLINHYTNAKDIWDNVKMFLEGETIHDYYVRFARLINDMWNIKMTMSRMQLNSKFVNNMLPEWGRFVTAVKLNIGLRESNYDQLYAYLKQYEVHANENKMMLDRFTQHTVDPLALMSNVSHQQYHSQSSITPPSTYVPPYFVDNTQLDSGLSLSDNLIKNLTNTLALLT
ncbi:hypothetical protein Tco_1134720 [Tanacetum coccineum]